MGSNKGKNGQKGGAWDLPKMAKDLITKNGAGDNEYLKLSPYDIDDILDDLQEDGEVPLHGGAFEEEREQRDEIKELYSRAYDDKVESDPEFKKILEFGPIKSLTKKYPSGSRLFPEGIKKTFMNHWFAFKVSGLTMDKLSDDGYLQGIGLSEGQAASILETIEQHKKQKANQGLAFSKGIGETIRIDEEGVVEKIATALRRQPYNEDVAERMRMGGSLKGIGKLGQARKRAKTKRKKTKRKKTNRKKTKRKKTNRKKTKREKKEKGKREG